MYYCKSRYYVPEWCRWLNLIINRILGIKEIMLSVVIILIITIRNLPNSAEKALKAKGIPDEYFDDIEILLPSIEDYFEAFPSVEKEPTITKPQLPEKIPKT